MPQKTRLTLSGPEISKEGRLYLAAIFGNLGCTRQGNGSLIYSIETEGEIGPKENEVLKRHRLKIESYENISE